MKIDCQWFTKNFEAYCTETLGPAESRQAAEHAASCSACARELQSYREIDPLIKQLFKHRMTLAQSPRAVPRGFGLRFAMAGGGLAIAAALAIFALLPDAAPPPAPLASNPVNPPVSGQEDALQNPAEAPAGIERAKPADHAEKGSATPGPETPVRDNAPAFMVIDAAGYATTLENYRGYALLFGVVSSERPETAAALERLYRTFSGNVKMRILGVSRRRENKPSGTTFPFVFNNGSRLLDAADGEVLLVGPDGDVRFEGSLLSDPDELAGQIKAHMEQSRR